MWKLPPTMSTARAARHQQEQQGKAPIGATESEETSLDCGETQHVTVARYDQDTCLYALHIYGMGNQGPQFRASLHTMVDTVGNYVIQLVVSDEVEHGKGQEHSAKANGGSRTARDGAPKPPSSLENIWIERHVQPAGAAMTCDPAPTPSGHGN